MAVTVGGYAVRHTQSNTQLDTFFSPLLPAYLSPIHMYKSKLGVKNKVRNKSPPTPFYNDLSIQWKDLNRCALVGL